MPYLAGKALSPPVPPLLTEVGEEESIYKGCFGYRFEELPHFCPITTGVAGGTQNPGQTDKSISSYSSKVVTVLQPDVRRSGHEVLTQSQMSCESLVSDTRKGEHGLGFRLVSRKRVPLCMENIKNMFQL